MNYTLTTNDRRNATYARNRARRLFPHNTHTISRYYHENITDFLKGEVIFGMIERGNVQIYILA